MNSTANSESRVNGRSDRYLRPTPLPGGVPVAVVGGPMVTDDFALFDLVESCGASVVLDATESGERTWPAPLDRRRVRDDPLGVLADAYFGHIPDAFRRPNTEFYRWFQRELADRTDRRQRPSARHSAHLGRGSHR